MIVVSDTSVVTALIQIGRIDLLAEIFGGVVIPEAVADELTVSHVALPAWIRTMCVRDRRVVEELYIELDAGESEAIALALELEADFLLMDEKLGRAAAQRAGITTIGILGVASAAKRKGLLSSVAPVIRELREQASFWISAERGMAGSQENLKGFGCLSGKISLSTDFDEPLEDFKDYT